jgi:hypothetical protein
VFQTIEDYAQELIDGELAQRLFQVTQKIHKKLPEHVSHLKIIFIQINFNASVIFLA